MNSLRSFIRNVLKEEIKDVLYGDGTLKMLKNLNQDQQNAVKELVSYINGVLAGPSDKTVKTLSSMLASGIMFKAPEESDLYRGMSFQLDNERFESFCQDIGIDVNIHGTSGMAEIDYRPIEATSSWTTDINVANRFAGKVNKKYKHEPYWSVLLSAPLSKNKDKFIANLYEIPGLEDFLEEGEVLGIGEINCVVGWELVEKDTIPVYWEI